MKKFSYGWKRGLPDPRRPKFTPHFMGELPTHIDLRPQCPKVYDQQDIGSCTAQSLAGLAEFLMIRQRLPHFTPSRLFIYYVERWMEGTIDEDAGAQIADGATVLGTNGCPRESLWWYNTAKYAVKPNQKVYADGLHCRVRGIATVRQNVDEMRKTLASGLPIVGGFSVFSGFESDEVANTGVVSMPNYDDEDMVGGHAVMIVGYDDTTRRFTVRNSWGEGWGDKGYCYMPYDYWTDAELSDDFWTGTGIEVGNP